MKLGAVVKNGAIVPATSINAKLVDGLGYAPIYASANLDKALYFMCFNLDGKGREFTVEMYDEADGNLFLTQYIGTFNRQCCAEMVCDMYALDGLTANK